MKYTYKGYTLSQTDYNNHFVIFAEDGRMVMHVPYNKSLTEEKAKEMIENYLILAEKLDENIDKLLEEDEDL